MNKKLITVIILMFYLNWIQAKNSLSEVIIPESLSSISQADNLPLAKFDHRGGAEVLTVGSDLDCDFVAIQSAINSIPVGALNHEIRVASNSNYQENLFIYTHSLKLVGGFDDCNAAAAGIGNNNHAQLDGSAAALPTIRIANPANYNNRQIVIERIDVSGGTGDQALGVPGGGINANHAQAEIYLTDMLINDNLGALGGGIYAVGQSTQLFLEDVLVLLNEATDGGGLYCDGSSVYLYGDSGVSANQATGEFLNGNGGGVYATNDCVFVLFSGTTGGFIDFRGIAGNQANSHGGGVYSASGSQILLYGEQLGNLGDNENPVNINGNEADADNNLIGDGGGIYATESYISAFALLLNNNQADNSSAAYLSQSDFYIQNNSGGCWHDTLCNQIRENTVKDVTDTDSYTILSLGNSSLNFKIHQTEVALNRASKSTFFFNQFSNIDLAGNLIYANGDDGLSGFVDKYLISVFRPNSFNLAYNTVVDNHLTDAIIHVAEASINPANIVSSIFQEVNGIEVINGSGSAAVGFDCIISHEMDSFNGNNVVVADPEFVDRDNQDFHLLPTSAAIDRCANNAVAALSTDLDGQQRGWDVPNVLNDAGPYDAGVDEYLTDTQADLQVSITLDTPGPYHEGQILNYTVVVENLGPDTALLGSLELFMSNLSIVSIIGDCNLINPCHFGNLLSGESKTFIYELRVGSGALFSASSAVISDIFDPDTSNNHDQSTEGVVTQYSSDLSVDLVIQTPPPYHHTQLITYHAIITNNGPDDIGNFTFSTGTLSINQVLHSVTGEGCSELPCTIDLLASGAASETLVLVYEVDSPGSFRGSVKVDTNTFWVDPDLTNNTANSEQLLADSLVDLSVSKTLLTTGPYAVGQTIVYNIQYANIGVDGAFMATLEDTPENMTINSVSGAGCTSFPCALGSLASGSGGALTVLATIDAMGSFNNTASISSQAGFDPNQSNNIDDGSVDNNNGGTTENNDLIFFSGFE
ncbi:DUF11 domain-containing protein [Marinicella sp. S1101]|uniref:DUF11 domain-containing protein n=1 Tax=Marinicella marina TaxID=2996016 RepID=UPI0022609D3A|nr:DUF11 domain-containing protein [Marinicella marina]MCX7554245.1 DUF11 domain-containing protein [Marinicella marina]MDJ1138762.1 DUF11 domain-containing protein [Marinicella marina]